MVVLKGTHCGRPAPRRCSWRATTPRRCCWPGWGASPRRTEGLGRVVALHNVTERTDTRFVTDASSLCNDRASASYQIHGHTRCLYFGSENTIEPY